MTGRLFKFLNADGSCRYAPGHHWPLPQNGEPGEWMPPIEGELRHYNAYHVSLGHDMVRWSGDALFEVEGRGEQVVLNNQILLREARLVRQVARAEMSGVYRE